jgi:psiF repeat
VSDVVATRHKVHWHPPRAATIPQSDEDPTMNKMLCLLACTALTAAFAAPTPPDDEEETKPPARAEGSQQVKMKTCNVEAHKKELKGDERRAFMSECLKKH